jgi:Outer membrane lipoprotein carrier protein LolA
VKRRLLLLAALPGALQADPLAPIQAQLGKPLLARGRFEQDKQLAGFAKPLRSSGEYLLVRGKGVVWRTLKPFAQQLVLTKDFIRADGGLQLDAAREPGVRVVTGLMLALLDGDLAALQSLFQLDAQLDGKGWRASATPKAAALAKLFSRIELAGDRQLRRVELQEAGGDATRIRFDELSAEPAPPTPDEVRALG